MNTLVFLYKEEERPSFSNDLRQIKPVIAQNPSGFPIQIDQNGECTELGEGNAEAWGKDQ